MCYLFTDPQETVSRIKSNHQNGFIVGVWTYRVIFKSSGDDLVALVAKWVEGKVEVGQDAIVMQRLTDGSSTATKGTR